MSEPEPYKIGTFVKVRDEAIKQGVYDYINRDHVKDHGWLWVVSDKYTGGAGDDRRYWCRSIATGVVKRWIHYEIEAYGET